MENNISYDHYYLSYSGTKLPLKLVSPIDPEEVKNRNTYFGACTDADGSVVLIHKLVYGEIELAHRYGYHEQGYLQWAEILGIDDEKYRLTFDAAGNVVEQLELED